MVISWENIINFTSKKGIEENIFRIINIFPSQKNAQQITGIRFKNISVEEYYKIKPVKLIM